MVHFKIFIIFFVIFFSVKSFAGFTNYNSLLMGEQAAGLGGAYVAMFGDTAASPYYNPAGLAWGKGNSFSASVSVYKKFDTVMGLEEDITKAPLRVNQGFFQSIPSSTGSVVKQGDYFLGLSIVVPEYDTFKGDVATNDTNTSVLNYLDESLWVGPTIGKKFFKDHSFGATIYYTARNYNRTVQDRTVNEATNSAVIFSEEKNIIGNSILMILGWQYRYTKNWRFGASLRTPSWQVAGTGSYIRTEIAADNDSNTLTLTNVTNTSLKSLTKIPAKFTTGLAYINQPWTLSMDASIYGAESYFDLNDDNLRSKVVHKVMANGSLGIEYRWYKWLKLRAGWFTNLTSQEELKESDKYGDRVDQLGFAANATFISKENINFTFGGYYTGGRGKSVQRIDQTYQIVPTTKQVFTMLVGTSYSF